VKLKKKQIAIGTFVLFRQCTVANMLKKIIAKQLHTGNGIISLRFVGTGTNLQLGPQLENNKGGAKTF